MVDDGPLVGGGFVLPLGGAAGVVCWLCGFDCCGCVLVVFCGFLF